MRLLTFRTNGGTQAGRVEGEEVVDLPFSDVGALLASGDNWPQVARAIGDRRPLDNLDLAPVVPHPSKIFCLGLNYLGHVQEGRGEDRIVPEFPVLFAKFADSLTGPRDKIMIPRASKKVDWEAELVVVIGKTVRNADEDHAIAAIAGYAVGNDVTMRDWQSRTSEWLQGKAWGKSSPVGPLVTSDEVGGDGRPDLEISCALDGVEMQKSRTSNLLFDCVRCVMYTSTVIVLRPGDLIFTGTCAGIGAARTPPVFIEPGQVLTTRIERLGELRNAFYAE
jgi:acylpyruvate hydrolase